MAENFTLDKIGVGASRLIPFHLRRADGVTAISLAGSVVLRFVVGVRGVTPKLIDKTLAAGGITLTDAAGGDLVVQVLAADTVAAGQGTHACALQATESDGTVTIWNGSWEIFDHALT